MNESVNWEHYAEESLTHDDYGTRPTDIAAQLAACDRYIADHASHDANLEIAEES